eukprot:111366-Hanusia_phi.AAC.1
MAGGRWQEGDGRREMAGGREGGEAERRRRVRMVTMIGAGGRAARRIAQENGSCAGAATQERRVVFCVWLSPAAVDVCCDVSG